MSDNKKTLGEKMDAVFDAAEKATFKMFSPEEIARHEENVKKDFFPTGDRLIINGVDFGKKN